MDSREDKNNFPNAISRSNYTKELSPRQLKDGSLEGRVGEGEREGAGKGVKVVESKCNERVRM